MNMWLNMSFNIDLSSISGNNNGNDNNDTTLAGFDWESFLLKYKPKLDDRYVREKIILNTVAITMYSIIFVISLFGNLLVCYVVYSKRQMKTVTNYFITNLTASDIMMTVVNIPFNIARLLLDDWPFGEFLCKLVPFIQTVSVYVSTITMCVIAVDRYQAIINPFGKRLSAVIPMNAILVTIWLVSCVFSIPHMYFNQVVLIELFSYKSMTRCRVIFPEPQIAYSRGITVLAFLTQYLIPLSIASIAYMKISYRIYRRGNLGAVTQQQVAHSVRSNRKTIKMLIIVLVVFAICWLPLNLYHIRVDFSSGPARHNLYLQMGVHWLAMSSVCYNPFIYSIRNSNFRDEMKAFFRCLLCFCEKPRALPNFSETNSSTTRTQIIPMRNTASTAANGKHYAV